MSRYPFKLIDESDLNPVSDAQKLHLRERPFTRIDTGFESDAPRFRPGTELADAINAAIALGEPLLLTGEPGTGKTQAAYYTAWKLGVPTWHFQTKSTSRAQDLLYDFDTVGYFHDAHLAREEQGKGPIKLDKTRYLSERPLWHAVKSAQKDQYPAVLLIDEIDKAPRDFPNDLLHELDKMEFRILETDTTIKAEKGMQPIVFITSNSERRLPEPFLRRCLFHHIEFTLERLWQAVDSHRDSFPNLSDKIKEKAVERFQVMRGRGLRKKPATGELLIWLRALDNSGVTNPAVLDVSLSKLPYLGALIKDHQDFASLKRG